MWWRTDTTPWQSLGGLFKFSPKPVVWNGVTYVFGIGIDDAIWYRTLTTLGSHSEERSRLTSP